MRNSFLVLILISFFTLPSVFADSKESGKDDEAFWEVFNYHMKALKESSEKAKELLKKQKTDESVNFEENQEADKMVNFQGDWWFGGVIYDEIEDYGKTTFNLNLSQKGDKITGSYISIAYDGNKIDDSSEKQTISGVVKGNVAIVNFKSDSWGGSGKAKIIHNGNKILWERIPGTGKGNYWCPHKAVLEKE